MRRILARGERIAYLLLRVGQILPLTSEPQGRILHGEMLEVAALVALLHEPQVRTDGCLDQALILDAEELGVAQPSEVLASGIGLFDLEGRVLLEPSFVGCFVGSPVFLGLVDKSLFQ